MTERETEVFDWWLIIVSLCLFCAVIVLPWLFFATGG